MVPQSDEEKNLLERVRKSDLDAFELLFTRYQPVLFRNALYQLRDAEAAHDIVQETFTRVWERRSSLKPALSFIAYLFRISTNLVRDRQRHEGTRQRSRDLVPLPIPPPDADPVDSTQYSLLSEAIRRAVSDDLPERCRMVFELSRLEGLTNGEIAKRLRISEKTVENQLTKALRILQRKLRAFRNT